MNDLNVRVHRHLAFADCAGPPTCRDCRQLAAELVARRRRLERQTAWLVAAVTVGLPGFALWASWMLGL